MAASYLKTTEQNFLGVRNDHDQSKSTVTWSYIERLVVAADLELPHLQLLQVKTVKRGDLQDKTRNTRNIVGR
jgi:hypothetical protein